MRLQFLALPLAGAVAALAPRPTEPADAMVEVRLFQFQSDTLEVPAGTRVRWTNHDDVEHTVTAGSGDSASGQFAGAMAGQGAIYEFRFVQPGRFAYFCDRHHFMRGEIRVTPIRKAGQ